jgi:hypothetical protein
MAAARADRAAIISAIVAIPPRLPLASGAMGVVQSIAWLLLRSTIAASSSPVRHADRKTG